MLPVLQNLLAVMVFGLSPIPAEGGEPPGVGSAFDSPADFLPGPRRLYPAVPKLSDAAPLLTARSRFQPGSPVGTLQELLAGERTAVRVIFDEFTPVFVDGLFVEEVREETLAPGGYHGLIDEGGSIASALGLPDVADLHREFCLLRYLENPERPLLNGEQTPPSVEPKPQDQQGNIPETNDREIAMRWLDQYDLPGRMAEAEVYTILAGFPFTDDSWWEEWEYQDQCVGALIFPDSYLRRKQREYTFFTKLQRPLADLNPQLPATVLKVSQTLREFATHTMVQMVCDFEPPPLLDCDGAVIYNSAFPGFNF